MDRVGLLVVAEGFGGVEAGGEVGREEGSQGADDHGAGGGDGDGGGDDAGRQFDEGIDVGGEEGEPEGIAEPVEEFVAEVKDEEGEADPEEGAHGADDEALTEEDPDDLIDAGADGFHDANLTSFLDGDGDHGVHDAEAGDDDDGEEKEEKHAAFDIDGVEYLAVHVHPGHGVEPGEGEGVFSVKG